MASETSSASSQLVPDSFHWTVYPVGVAPEPGASQDARSLPLSCRATVRLFGAPGAGGGTVLGVPEEAVLFVTACPLKDSAALPDASCSLFGDSPVGAV